MDTADDLIHHAQTRKFAGDYAGALQLRLQAEQLLASAPAEAQASNYNMISFLAVNLRDLVEAERAARRALELYTATTDVPDWISATYTFMLASILATAGRFEEAVPIGETAIDMFVATDHNATFVDARRAELQHMRQHRQIQYVGD